MDTLSNNTNVGFDFGFAFIVLYENAVVPLRSEFVANPWTNDEISEARTLPLLAVIEALGAYYKVDKTYTPLDPHSGSKRVQVSYQGREFRFILTGEKFINELLPKDDPKRGGGGAIDFASHLTGLQFVHAVKICLDARHMSSVA